MKLGWCAPFSQASLVLETGYDYLEAPLSSFGLEDEASLAAAKRMVAQAPLPLSIFNNFYPRDMRVVGPDVDSIRVKAYLHRAAELAHHVGAKALVLGSAWSRNVPDGFSRALAGQQQLCRHVLPRLKVA